MKRQKEKDKNMRVVSVHYIRSVSNRMEKITLEQAVDMIKTDPAHLKYERTEIENALRKGIKIQLDNYTLQIIGNTQNSETEETE